MRIPGLQIVRVLEFRVDATPVREVWTTLGKRQMGNGVTIVPFAGVYRDGISKARSPAEAAAFLRMQDGGESGWLALGPEGQVVGHCWRLDNKGTAIVRSSVPIDPGWAYLHYGWVTPAWRGQGILPALMCNGILQALADPSWTVRGFSADIAPTNTSSQRSASKLGFLPVRCLVSLRFLRRWFQVRSCRMEGTGSWTSS